MSGPDERIFAPAHGWFVEGPSAYRYTLNHQTDTRAQWTVTRTEAGIVETPATPTEPELRATIAADFHADVAGIPVVPTWLFHAPIEAREVAFPPPGEVCGACGAYVAGGSDPAVMSAHDCEGEEG